ncbi:hypothetical protein Cgig2_022694 [Carnegiea gigantea]|uniref:Ribulose bisphosphate carboxylase large subunit C-terminal domain-containing protein n=1 Tax=Carnegiea gigantea TaxID=171969 RepID=A0A9Q1Q5I3_9CARY|nr:hypothetical protein Cgig2_022694 [Carnegiea gigantea]
MHWRNHLLFCAQAIYKARAETGEIKEHYLNATVGTCEEMIKRTVFPRDLGVPIIMHDYLIGGFNANTSLTFYCQDNGVLPVASGGIHVRHMPALTKIFEGDSVLQLSGGTLGHPWGNAPGAVANRVALEACVQACNEGRDHAREGATIIRNASK